MTDAMHSAQPEAPIDAEPVLSVRGATKTFGAVVALDGVDLEVRSGEVLALLGDNGAGKSTLIKCISGVHKLDRGEIRIDGALVQISSAADARSNGIETVYQDLALFDNLNPTANFFAGREVAHPSWLPRGLQWMKKKEMSTRTKELLDRLQIRLPHFDADVALMSGGQRRRSLSPGLWPSPPSSSSSTSRPLPSGSGSRPGSWSWSIGSELPVSRSS